MAPAAAPTPAPMSAPLPAPYPVPAPTAAPAPAPTAAPVTVPQAVSVHVSIRPPITHAITRFVMSVSPFTLSFLSHYRSRTYPDRRQRPFADETQGRTAVFVVLRVPGDGKSFPDRAKDLPRPHAEEGCPRRKRSEWDM